MDDFKIIPKAKEYKINKEGEIRRVANDKPLLLLPGRVALLKNNEGVMERFIVDDVVKELFSILESTAMTESTSVQNIASEDEENNTNESEDANLIRESDEEIAEQAEDTSEPKSKLKAPKGRAGKASLKKPAGKIGKAGLAKAKTESKKEEKTFVATKEVEKILELDCSDSIKIWKLHQAGCSTDEMLAHLKQPKRKAHSFNGIVWRYKKHKKLRDRADSK